MTLLEDLERQLMWAERRIVLADGINDSRRRDMEIHEAQRQVAYLNKLVADHKAKAPNVTSRNKTASVSNNARQSSLWQIGDKIVMLDAWMRNPTAGRIVMLPNAENVVMEDERGVRHYGSTARIVDDPPASRNKKDEFADLLGEQAGQDEFADLLG